jgi:predicted metal-dependent hydrolase
MKLLDVIKQHKPGSSISYHITPRKVKFDWENTPIDWIPNEPFASYFINQIHLILPAGEFWFCRLYNKALPFVTDEKLREDVQAFIRQEAMHARAHGSAIKEYLNERNIDTSRNEKIMNYLFETLLADEPFGMKVPKALQKFWLVERLGIIAAVEHMTCVLGQYALRNKNWDRKGADAEIPDILRWHGAEEIEHRSVAFDLYYHLGGTYPSRYYLSAIVVPLVLGLWVDGASDILKQDSRFADKKPSVLKPWVWKEWLMTSRRRQLPNPIWLVLQQLPYFSPWYDPVLEASTEEALSYLAKSPAAKRAAETTA